MATSVSGRLLFAGYDDFECKVDIHIRPIPPQNSTRSETAPLTVAQVWDVTRGEKVGSLGRSLPGSQPVEVVKIDFGTRLPLRDTDGHLVKTGANEAGLLATALDPEDTTQSPAVVESAFESGDRWLLTADIMRRDEDGDLWFVDSRAGIVITQQGFASTRNVESALFALPEVEMAAAWGEKAGAEWRIVAAIQSRTPIDDKRIDEALSVLSSRERPVRVQRVDAIPITEGFRPDKAALRSIVDLQSDVRACPR